MKLGIRAKLFFISLSLIGVSLIPAGLLLIHHVEMRLMDQMKRDLVVRLRVAEKEVGSMRGPMEQSQAWDDLATDIGKRASARMTIISNGGTVVGDSDVKISELEGMENHGEQSEVAEALRSGLGSLERWSGTLRKRLLYVAVPFVREHSNSGVIRMAVSLDDVDRALSELKQTLLLGALAMIVAAAMVFLLASNWMVRRVHLLTDVARAMASGNLSVKARVGGNDEISALGHAMEQLASQFSVSLDELKSKQELLERLFWGMEEGVLVLDREGHIHLVNPALRRMFLLGDDVLGKLPIEVFRNASLQECLRRAQTEGPSPSTEFELGGLKPRRILLRAVTSRDNTGSVLAVFVDVTEIRKHETVRKDFVANVSHELRTPVAVIRSASETLEGVAVSDPNAIKQFSRMILENSQRLEQLIDDLLDLSRIESGEIRFDLESVEIAPILENIQSLFQEKIIKKNILWKTSHLAGGSEVFADRRALEQVLANLVDNAIKYCPSGCSLEVSSQSEAENVRIEVRDNGPGIEPKDLPRLFERFYRVDPGRSRDVGGTGLGLSIVKNLIEGMGGTISAESVVGVGTTFRIILPARKA